MSKKQYTTAEQEAAFSRVTPRDEVELYRETSISLGDIDKVPTVQMAFAAYMLDTAKVKTMADYLAMDLTELSDLFEKEEEDEDPKVSDSDSEDTES